MKTNPHLHPDKLKVRGEPIQHIQQKKMADIQLKKIAHKNKKCKKRQQNDKKCRVTEGGPHMQCAVNLALLLPSPMLQDRTPTFLNGE